VWDEGPRLLPLRRWRSAPSVSAAPTTASALALYAKGRVGRGPSATSGKAGQHRPPSPSRPPHVNLGRAFVRLKGRLDRVHWPLRSKALRICPPSPPGPTSTSALLWPPRARLDEAHPALAASRPASTPNSAGGPRQPRQCLLRAKGPGWRRPSTTTSKPSAIDPKSRPWPSTGSVSLVMTPPAIAVPGPRPAQGSRKK